MKNRYKIQSLATFRREIRCFLQFSERAAAKAGLEAQQHQLLLQIAGAPDDALITVSYVAEAMGLRHHTVVELSKRCEKAGLVLRVPDLADRRRVVLGLTARGEEALEGLSDIHARQLRELAPVLVRALTRIRKAARSAEISNEERNT